MQVTVICAKMMVKERIIRLCTKKKCLSLSDKNELCINLGQRSRGERLSKMRLPERDTRVHCSCEVAEQVAEDAAGDRSEPVERAKSAALSRVSPEASKARAAIRIHAKRYAKW